MTLSNTPSSDPFGEDAWQQVYNEQVTVVRSATKQETCAQILAMADAGETLDEAFVTAVLDEYADLPAEVMDALIADGSDEMYRRAAHRKDVSEVQLIQMGLDVLEATVDSFYTNTSLFSSYQIPVWLLWVAFELAYPDGDSDRSPVMGDYLEFTANLFYNILLPLQVRAVHTDLSSWREPYKQGSYWFNKDGELLTPHQEAMEGLSIWPDLADLPLEMKVQVLSTQPVEDPRWGFEAVPDEHKYRVQTLLDRIND